ncbi:hypothetical protein GTR02_06800 [Kineococcus sp. R8]|uniref:hypothetical protein n=1 Tax=Kineococcus siccus TaxID=2696567 RepID=UPI00141312A3|nr:hypothetical protein [Kineococcus siccus]NAZ81524.1 hypothetical protein [Kineococcus siccus]
METIILSEASIAGLHQTRALTVDVVLAAMDGLQMQWLRAPADVGLAESFAVIAGLVRDGGQLTGRAAHGSP